MFMDTYALDKLDQAILRRLQDNGRETYDVIGDRVGLSASAVLRRVKRSGSGCLNSFPRFLSGLRAGCQRCRDSGMDAPLSLASACCQSLSGRSCPLTLRRQL